MYKPMFVLASFSINLFPLRRDNLPTAGWCAAKRPVTLEENVLRCKEFGLVFLGYVLANTEVCFFVFVKKTKTKHNSWIYRWFHVYIYTPYKSYIYDEFRCITYYIHYIYIHIDMTAPYIVLELPCSGGAVPDDADALGDATAVDGIAAGRVELRSVLVQARPHGPWYLEARLVII